MFRDCLFKGIALFLGLVCLSLVSSAEATVDSLQVLALSAQEKVWLKEHPVVRVGIDPNFEPYEFITEKGQFLGIAQEYLALLSTKLGVEFKPTLHKKWSDVITAIKHKEIDVLSSVTETPQRLNYLNFTKTYLKFKAAIVTQWDSYQINGLEDLAGKPVALVKDYALSELILAREPSIKPIYVETILDGLTAITNHKAVAIVSDLGSVTYQIRKYKMNNLEVAGLVGVGAEGLSMAVRKDWFIFSNILDKALASISEKEKRKILRRWIPVEEKPKILLSESEKQFIKQHQVIHLGVDPEFAPFEFIDKTGNYAGMTSDYLQLLSRRLGVQFEVQKGITWDEAVNQVKLKQLDMLPAVGKTEERSGYLIFSKAYLQFHRVIIVRVGNSFSQGIGGLTQLRVAVQRNSSHEGFLKQNTSIQPIVYDTLQETLKAVSDGRVDAMVGNVASSSYWIRKMNLTNLKVAAAAGDIQSLYFAVRDDWPELVSAINKALDSISLMEKHRISEKWVTIKYDPKTDYVLIKKIIGSFLVFLSFLSLWLMYAHKQRALLEEARNEAVDANRKLEAMHKDLEKLVDERTEALMVSERKFRQAQKMESLGTLASGIAHDINNLLMGMITAVQLVQMKSKEKNEKLTRVCEQGFQAADMIKQLMAFSRKEPSEKEHLQLNGLLRDTENLVKASVSKEVNLSFVICEQILNVNANSTQIQQVIFNLCNNAAFALTGVFGAQMTVSLTRFDADEKFMTRHPDIFNSAFACIKVEDNGVGIPEELLDNIFDPFFTTKDKGEGTGLGLAMVYGTIQEHGGVIEVDSQLGKGSCFTIYLPLVERD